MMSMRLVLLQFKDSDCFKEEIQIRIIFQIIQQHKQQMLNSGKDLPMRHQKHMICYLVLVAIIGYYLYHIIMAKSAGYHTPMSTSGTDGTGGSVGNKTTSDLRMPTTQGSVNKLYTAFTRRRLGVTNF